VSDSNLKHVVLAGGNGMVGRHIVEALLKEGTQVTVLSRSPEAANLPSGATARSWDELPSALEGADAIINLAGEGIADKRWSDARKRAIVQSRVESTTRLIEACAKLAQKPATFVNASAVGFYGGHDGSPLDENTKAGDGFLAKVCVDWEKAAENVKALGVRLVLMRIGVVLEAKGGALPKIALPIKLFQGAKLGSGQQGLSWIHIDDLVALILEAAKNSAFEGPINATAPMPVTNETFTRYLAKALHRPVLPVPAFMTELGVKLLVGEMAQEMLLDGAFVYPRKAEKLGFNFKFRDAETAIADLVPKM
jgi:uncharacterized protein